MAPDIPPTAIQSNPRCVDMNIEHLPRAQERGGQLRNVSQPGLLQSLRRNIAQVPVDLLACQPKHSAKLLCNRKSPKAKSVVLARRHDTAEKECKIQYTCYSFGIATHALSGLSAFRCRRPESKQSVCKTLLCSSLHTFDAHLYLQARHCGGVFFPKIDCVSGAVDCRACRSKAWFQPKDDASFVRLNPTYLCDFLFNSDLASELWLACMTIP